VDKVEGGYVLHTVGEQGYLVQEERVEAPYLVLQEAAGEVQETSQYLQVVEAAQEQTGRAPRHLRSSGAWQEQGGGAAYARRAVSRPADGPGRDAVSQGTVIAAWTKMPEERVRVAHNKVVIARTRAEGDEEEEGAVSAPLARPCGRLRDAGSQVAPHRVSGRPTSAEEEQGQAARVRDFLQRGGVLDRSCPGCGKVMSRQRNLVTHLKVIHGVVAAGREAREHEARHSRENVKLQCAGCHKFVSRKSMKRHSSLCRGREDGR